MKISRQGIDFIKSFESFVPYVYDDKRSPIKGKYRKYKPGHEVVGTLTVLYGHTDSAKHPLRIKDCIGKDFAEEFGCEVLDVDLDECEQDVNERVKVPLEQGQFDALTSFTFNCGAGNLQKLISPLNRGDYATTRAKFDLYVKSKGEYMRGLQRRRDGEQAMWDDVDVALPTEPVHHPAEVDPTPTVTPATLPQVSRKARDTARFKLAWKSISIAGVLSSLGLAKDTSDQVGRIVADHWLAILITTAVLVIIFIKWIEGLMAEDVNEGRAVPSGGMPAQ